MTFAQSWIELTPHQISLTSSTRSSVQEHLYAGTPFTNFEPISSEGIKKLVLNAPNETCDNAHIPTKTVKDCINELLPTIFSMVNLSLSSGHFPDIWKEGLVRPKLKKVNLDLIKKNYRPVIPFKDHWKGSCTTNLWSRVIQSDVSRISISLRQISQHGDCLTAHAQRHTRQHHRRTGRGARGAAAAPKFWQLRFFGQQEKIWAKPVFKDVSMFIIIIIIIIIIILKR